MSVKKACARHNYHLHCGGKACNRGVDCHFDHRDELPSGITAQDIPSGHICVHGFLKLYGVGQGCKNSHCKGHHVNVSKGFFAGVKRVGGGLWGATKRVGRWTIVPVVHHSARVVAWGANGIVRATASKPKCRLGSNCSFKARGTCKFDHSRDPVDDDDVVLPDIATSNDQDQTDSIAVDDDHTGYASE